MRRSKTYRSQLEGFDRLKAYPIAEAIDILQNMRHMKFDETVDVSMKLGIDPKQSDQNVRGAIPLPKGTGKKVTVAVIADAAPAEEAKNAGADHVGFEELIDKIKEGWMDFDVLIATPTAMPKVRPLGRFLGPRGLMPNPKTGTVTDQVGDAVAQAKAGRVEFRNDKGGCIHVPFGKMSFPKEDLAENFTAIMRAIVKAKPASAKGAYVSSCAISSTMSPGIKVDVKDYLKVMR